MIIQCPQCLTKYKVADEKVKTPDTKVQCKKCQVVFRIPGPKAEKNEVTWAGEVTHSVPSTDLSALIEDELKSEEKEEEEALPPPPPKTEQMPEEPEQPKIDTRREPTTVQMVEKKEEEPKPSLEVEPIPMPPMKKKGRVVPFIGNIFSYLRTLGFIVGIILLLLIGNILLKPQVAEIGEKIRTLLSRQVIEEELAIMKETVDFSIVKNIEQRDVLILSGTIVNNFTSPVNYVKVRGLLYDKYENLILKKEVYAGNIFTKDQIYHFVNQSSMDKSYVNVGMNLANFNIQPKGKVKFQIIFIKPPKRIKEYKVEIAGYQLVGQRK